MELFGSKPGRRPGYDGPLGGGLEQAGPKVRLFGPAEAEDFGSKPGRLDILGLLEAFGPAETFWKFR